MSSKVAFEAQAGFRMVTWEDGEAAVLPERWGPCISSVQ